MLKVADFDYELPEELIALAPTDVRDQSRLLVVNNTQLLDLSFKQITDFIKPNDLVIFNNSKVIKARIFGQKLTGGKIELLIERVLPDNSIIAHVRSNKTIPLGLKILLPQNKQITIIEKLDGLFKLSVTGNIDWINYLEQFGNIPLPPYIRRNPTNNDDSRYQTVYANHFGSVAAPTAGLHFTSELLENITILGAKIAYVTLHVGSGTFKPVSTEYISQHKMHSELYSISPTTIDLIKECKSSGGNIIAVGTTSLRTLEAAAQNNFTHLNGDTDIFITPGYEFKIVNKLITNFHLPKSTLLMLVSAFSGIETIKQAYRHAINNNYRFFSYGDAMLLTRTPKD